MLDIPLRMAVNKQWRYIGVWLYVWDVSLVSVRIWLMVFKRREGDRMKQAVRSNISKDNTVFLSEHVLFLFQDRRSICEPGSLIWKLIKMTNWDSPYNFLILYIFLATVLHIYIIFDTSSLHTVGHLQGAHNFFWRVQRICRLIWQNFYI